jgi:ATP-dependent DNA helicase PIF1
MENHNIELSMEQQYAKDLFEAGHNLFITGPAGTGKTTLVMELLNSAKRRMKNMQCTAMTGCAAILLPKSANARTIHSWSGVKIDKGPPEKVVRRVMNNDKAAEAWIKSDILHIDEVSMMSAKFIDILDSCGKNIRNCDKPFGGIQVIMTGDFYQLPPILTKEDPDTGKFCFTSPIWKKLFTDEEHVVLKTIFRQKDDTFRSILNGIRVGQICKENASILRKHINRQYNKDDYNGCVLTKLVPTRRIADNINDTNFNKLEEVCYEYNMHENMNCTEIMDGSGRPIPEKVLDRCNKVPNSFKIEEIKSLKSHSPARECVELKVGAQVMCLANLSLEEGICNGSIGIIQSFYLNTSGVTLPIVKFSNGIVKKLVVHYWQSDDNPTIAIGQIPLCLAWAITIHKSQGCTMERAQIDIGNQIFECGQTYVGISRVKSLDGLYLSGFSPYRIKANPQVQAFYDSIPEIELEYEDEDEDEDNVPDNTTHTNTMDFTKYTLESDQLLQEQNYIDDVRVITL